MSSTSAVDNTGTKTPPRLRSETSRPCSVSRLSASRTGPRPTWNAPAAFRETVLRDPRVRKVSFTGSTPVGRTLLNLASHNVLRTSMELGGNAPLLVFDDADLERAVTGTFNAKMRNGGQSCIAANRILVQDGIHDAFVEGLVEAMAAVVVGSGFAPPQVGARTADRRPGGRVDGAAGRRRVRPGGRLGADRRIEAAVGRALLRADGAVGGQPPIRWPPPPRSSGRSPRCSGSAPRRRRSPGPTPPNSVWPVTCSPRAWIGRSTSPTASRPGWWESTRGGAVQRRGAVRWHQAVRHRPRRQQRGTRRIPGGAVLQHRPPQHRLTHLLW